MHPVLSTDSAGTTLRAARGGALISWPLVMAACAYAFSLFQWSELLVDGDTYWHITTGRWILEHGSIPAVDTYSHTMPGAAWTAHEWLSELVLALAHAQGGWLLVVAATASAFAATVALLTRALLRWLEPVYAILFAGLALSMTAGHLLARPHILAMPLLLLWTIELVHASEAGRAPRWWFLPLMTLWANLHGGFTLGLALAGAFALEAVLAAAPRQRLALGKRWGVFLVLAGGCSLLTPHGVQGILFTWQVMAGSSYALERIGEWRSPNFQTLNALELWLVGGLAVVLHQGLRLPPIRLILVLGLLHLALKHVRYVELVGILTPLFFAGPFAAQWQRARRGQDQVQSLDRLFAALARPAGLAAVAMAFTAAAAGTLLYARARPLEVPASMVPVRAIAAVQKAGIQGRVLNGYGSGGYLIYAGIPVFIDGRSDLYGDAFLKQYVEALELRVPGALEKLIARYAVDWTLLAPNDSANELLAHLPGWTRLYQDDISVVYARSRDPSTPAASGLRSAGDVSSNPDAGHRGQP